MLILTRRKGETLSLLASFRIALLVGEMTLNSSKVRNRNIKEITTALRCHFG